jgi:flagellar FliL protein
MAQNDEDLDLDVAGNAKPKGGAWKKIVLFSVIGVLLIGLSVTTTMLFLGTNKAAPEAVAEQDNGGTKSAEKAKEVKKPAEHKTGTRHYLNLDPPFVVNLNDDSNVRFLQVQVSVMAYSEEALETVKLHMPVIRNDLVLLFSSQKFSDIRTPEGKKKLQKEALDTVRSSLEKAAGKPLVEALYLPSIVGQ